MQSQKLKCLGADMNFQEEEHILNNNFNLSSSLSMSSSILEKLGKYLRVFEAQTKLLYSYKIRVFSKNVVKNNYHFLRQNNSVSLKKLNVIKSD